MKIQLQSLFFYPSTGGIQNYLYYASKALLKMGHEPTILCSQHQPDLPEREIYDNIEVVRHPYYRLPRIPFATINPIYYVKKLQKFLENNPADCDVIWSRYFYEAYASGKAFRGEIPVIFIPAVIATSLTRVAVSNATLITKVYAKSVYPQHHYMEKKAIKMCDKVVVLSQSKMREIRDFYNLDEEKFAVIPPGVDLEVFRPSRKDETLLKELSLVQDSKIVLTVGRLRHEKNLEMLIRAFGKLDTKGTFLVVVGDGPEKPYLERLVERLDLMNRTKFVGARKDVERFYSIADVFVLPSRYEGFGHVFLEAMASGVPCIGLRSDYPNVITACDEIIRDGETGYLAGPYSVDDLAEKVATVISDAHLRSKLGREARRVCETEYTWEKTVQALLNLGQELLRGNSTRSC